MSKSALLLATLCLVGLPLASGCGGSTSNPPAAPTATGVSPSTGFIPGGAALAITGTGFVANNPGVNTVTIGGAPAGAVTAVSDTELTCLAPPGPAGPADVAVQNNSGTGALTGGFTYYSYPPNFMASDVKLDTDVPVAGSSDDPQICCNGPNVYVVWADSRHGSPDVFFNRSTDGGSTWLASDVRLETDGLGASISVAPKICCSGTNLCVVWGDERNAGLDIYAIHSTDGGATWPASDVRVCTVALGAGTCTDHQICCDGANVYVVWHDFRNHGVNADIYFNRSTDGGATWLAADVQLDTDGLGAAASYFPAICCEGTSVHAAWQDGRSGPTDIYYNRSTDGGGTWLGSDLRLDTDAAPNLSLRPRLCCAGTNVYAVWEDDRGAGPWRDIYMNRSVDGGATWLATDVRLDTDGPGATDSEQVAISCEGSNVYVAWADRRVALPDVRLNRSSDAGSSWLAADLQINTSPAGSASCNDPQVCCTGKNVYVVWADDRNGAPDIRLNCSIDGGATWLPNDRRLDTDLPPGMHTSWTPQVCCTGANAYVVWSDSRNVVSDIYYNATQP